MYKLTNELDGITVVSLEQAVAAPYCGVLLVNSGARVIKVPKDTFWGGYSGYFSDLDGHLWEIAWNPHFWVE